MIFFLSVDINFRDDAEMKSRDIVFGFDALICQFGAGKPSLTLH